MYLYKGALDAPRSAEGLERGRVKARRPVTGYLTIQARGDWAGSSRGGDIWVDLQGIFHIEQVRLANALNKLMNELLNSH